MPRRRRERAPAIAGMAMLALLLGATLVMPMGWREIVRENAFDLVLAAHQLVQPLPVDTGAPVTVVDIDRRSIEALGSWPWPRERLAQLIEAVAAENPAAAAVDILFAQPDIRSPAELARRLGALTGRDD